MTQELTDPPLYDVSWDEADQVVRFVWSPGSVVTMGQARAGPLARRVRTACCTVRTGQQVRGGGGEEVSEGWGAGSHARSREPFAEVVEPHGDPSGW